MSPDLSVIIPTYNRADYLEQCLRSLAQCGVERLEVIVVDDGSTDETPTRFANDPRCRFFRQSNQGPAAARNLGVDQSSGRYLAFLDCDDQWLPDVATRVINLLDRFAEVMVVFTEAHVGNDRDGYTSWIKTAGQETFFSLPHRSPEPGFRILEQLPFFRRMAVRNAVFIGATVLRREAFEKVGRFDPKLCGAADWELWLRMAAGMTFAFSREPLAIYTRHDNNMSSHFEGMLTEFCSALTSVMEKCPNLAQSERKLLAQCLKDQTYGLAYGAYDRGEIELARARFARCLSLGGGPAAFAYWLGCCLPPSVLQGARRFKQSVAR